MTPRPPPPANPPFPYDEAFSRNIGWVTEAEQAQLRRTRVAIAGLGGVGGTYLLTLARLGIGAFSIADFDEFDYANFNRQSGATVSSLRRPKLEVMMAMAHDINPQIDFRVFPAGVTADGVGAFLDQADVYLDGLDFFALAIRRQAFAHCRTQGIPAVTVAPLGMGAALLNFTPRSMSFERYFRFDDHDEHEQALRFLVGLSPAMLQLGYLVDPSRVDLAQRRGPSTVMAVQLCAGIAAVQVLKLVLRRGDVVEAPRGLHFDAYCNRLAHTWRPGGNANPIQRAVLAIARRRLRPARKP